MELVGPDEGETAEGEWGVGRMAEPGRDRARGSSSCSRRRRLAGKRVLVTAGGTREPVDAVRFVGNRSSGRMGVALAEEARRRGAEVVLLAANLAVPAPAGVETIPTPTAEAMLDAALALADFDIALLAAAVADYRPAEALAAKRAEGRRAAGRSSSSRPPTSRACSASASAPGQVLVAFGAELGEEGLERKRRMLDDEERRPRRLQRRLARRHRLRRAPRTRSCSSRATASGTSEGLEGRDRGRDPRRGGAPARR